MAKKRKPIGVAMGFEEYQALPGENWSSIKHLWVSPRHYEHARRQPPLDRTSFMLGRAAHCAILEPDRFPLDFAVFPGARRQGNDWDAFREAHRGQTIIKAEEYDEALAIRDAVLGHRDAKRLLRKGESERVIVWRDERSGLTCKGRVDRLRDDGVVDMKRTANLDPWRFERTAYDLGYHLQLAFYRRGVAALRGLANRSEVDVWVIAVEGSAPHDVAPFVYDPGALATADEEIDRLLELLVTCRKRRRWPGRYEAVTPLSLPAWAFGASEGEEDDSMDLTIGGAA